MTRHKAYTKIPFAALFFAATLISPALHALNIPDYRFHTMPETSYSVSYTHLRAHET